jgi:isoleucyl-tRNA synthetase
MLVLGVALFGKTPYKNVVVNGLLLAEDGQKMSKSKKNFPDLKLVIDKYGSDALRYYLMSSPLVRAQDVSFTEKGVDEVVKKHIGRLNNVVTFFEMYTSRNESKVVSNNVLDLWILAKLSKLQKEVTESLEKYEIDRAARPFADFIDDLSTWYIRRSRDRFKSEDINEKIKALSVTREVLLGLVKLLAPFMPFISDDIYLRLRGDKQSVHLDSWPSPSTSDHKTIEYMREVRRFASLGLEARMKAKINVRQPLSRLTIKSSMKLSSDYLDLIKDEVNVKEVILFFCS